MMNILTMALSGLFILPGANAAMADLPPTAPIVEPAAKQTHSVKLTAYNAVPEQTDGDPDVTASGARSNPEVIVARSRDLAEELPFGTVIALEAPVNDTSCGFTVVEHLIGYRVIADTMHSRKKQQIDVMFDLGDTVSVGTKETNPAIAMGICQVTARVVGKIDVKEIPETQIQLTYMVEGITIARR